MFKGARLKHLIGTNKLSWIVALFLPTMLFNSQAHAAGKVTKMAFATSAKTVQAGSCSSAVNVQAQTSTSQATPVAKKTVIFFTGSSPDLSFYSDARCLTKVTTINMAAGANTASFYFKGSNVGTKNVIVATYNYEDAQQNENIVSAAPAPAPTPKPSPTPVPSPSPAPNPPPIASADRIYGVTITNPWNQMPAILNSLSRLAYRPTARIVFDEFVKATDYQPIASQIHQVSFTMGEILDSFYVPKYTTQQYLDRTTEYLTTLGSSIDIWEIGNEINGEWVGDTPTVVSKMTGAYDIVKAAGKTTALTLYFNQGCYEKADHEMFTWAQANVPARMKTGLDYVFISFYEDDCNGIQPNWNVVFQQLGAMFPNSKIGFGETGTIHAALKETYINRYYKMAINHPRYVYGDFWWYFDQSDMVPQTDYLWTVLNNAMISSTPAK